MLLVVINTESKIRTITTGRTNTFQVGLSNNGLFLCLTLDRLFSGIALSKIFSAIFTFFVIFFAIFTFYLIILLLLSRFRCYINFLNGKTFVNSLKNISACIA